MKLTSHGEKDTERLGKALSGVLKKGDFVALYGELGAGKTALSRGIALALGSDECASPTFTIVREYRTDPPLYHFDAYRLSGADELYEIGCDEYFGGKGIVLMEWPEVVSELLPKNRVEVTIKKIDDDTREIEISGLSKERARDVAKEYAFEDTCY